MARRFIYNSGLAAGCLALASLSGCGVTELEGQLDDNQGNQSVGAGIVGGSAIQADTVELRTIRGELVATAEVAGDGSFSFGQIEPMAAPYLIETRFDGALTGRALGAVDLFADQRTLVGSVSHETSAEAEAFLRLAGEQGAENVDPIGVIINISSEMAATANLDAMADAAWQAQAAWQAAIEAETGERPSAEEMHDARILAFAELMSNLSFAADQDAEREAWAEFHTRARATIRNVLNVDTEAQATAAAAAALALASRFEGEEGGFFALALAADLAARVSQEAVAEDAEEQAESEGELRAEARARVEAAFDLFFQGVAEARDQDDVEQARLDLEAMLTGEDDSLLAGMFEGEGLFDGLLDLMLELSAAIGLELDAFSQAEGGENASAAAIDLRSTIDAQVTGALRGEASDETADFAAESQFAISVQAGLSLSTDAQGGGEPEDGRAVGGVVLDGVLGLQLGAEGVAEGEGNASIMGDSVAVIRVGEDGSTVVIGEGELDINGTIDLLVSGAEFENEDAQMFILEVLAEGEVVGAVILEEGEVEEGGDIESAPVTLESTLEALIALELAGDGQTVDRAVLEAMIDAAVAATEDGTERSLDVMAEAVLAAQTTFEASLNTTAEEMNRITAEARAELAAALAASAESAEEARGEFEAEMGAAIQAALGVSADAVSEARLQAAVAFEAVVSAQAMAMDDSARAAADARAGLDAAAAVSAQMAGELQGEAAAQFDAAIDAFAAAVAEAESAADVEQAQDELRAALIGEGNGSVLATLTASAAFLEEGAIDGAIEGMAAAEAELRAQFDAAAELAGQADGALAGEAMAAAYADFALDAQAATAGLLAFDGLSRVDGEAVAALLVTASAGVFGELNAQ